MKNLENIVNKLGIIGQDKKVSSEYDPKVLTSTDKYIKDLGGININTEEGVAKYEQLTGFQTDNVSPGKTESNYKIAQAGVSNIFGEYTTKHIEPIIKELETEELGDMIQSNIGYSFCPETESKSEKYNTVRNIVYTSRDTIEQIKENSEEYINKQISDAPDFMKAVIAKFSDEILKIDTEDEQRKAFKAIHEHGSAKFLIETHKHLEALETAYITDIKTLNEREMKMKNANPYLDTNESVKYLAEIETTKAEIEKRAKQLKSPSELTNAITQNAINVIQEKERIEAEKKAKAKAKL